MKMMAAHCQRVGWASNIENLKDGVGASFSLSGHRTNEDL